MMTSRPNSVRRACALLLAALSAAAAGCVSTSKTDRAAMEKDALLINVWQEVYAYFTAANKNDAEQVRKLREQIQPKVDGNLAVFTDFLLRGKNDDEKMMAACILGLSSSRKVVPILIDALDSPSDGLRHHACLGLGTFGYVGTPAEPIVKLLGDPSAVVRRDAAWVLSRILQKGDGSRFLVEDDVQDWSGFSLKMAQEAESEAAPGRRLLDLFPKDVQDLVRDAAQRGAFLDDHRSDLLRVLNAAIRQRDLYREKDFASVEIPAAAKDLLARPRPTLPGQEVEMLNRLLLEAAYPGFITLAQNRERGWALAALLRALDDEDPTVRGGVILALGRIASPESVDPLVKKGLVDNVREVRINAACALGLIRDRRAVEPLIQAMRDHQQDVPVMNAIKFGLREITGQDFGGSYTNWKAWWEEQKLPPPKMPGQETGPEPRKDDAKKEDGTKDGAQKSDAKAGGEKPKGPVAPPPAPPTPPR